MALLVNEGNKTNCAHLFSGGGREEERRGEERIGGVGTAHHRRVLVLCALDTSNKKVVRRAEHSDDA